MYVTRHSGIGSHQLLDQLWDLYLLSYEKIAEQDITRETLFRHEFNEVMSDSTYRTTLVHDDDGTPLGMTVVATDIGVTRYLSVPYFRRRYPQRLESGRIHYLMWAVIHPDHQASRVRFELGRAGMAQAAEDGVLLVFDLPESNQPAEGGGGAEALRRMAQSMAEVQLESFGVSRYYALDFAPLESESPAADPAVVHQHSEGVEASVRA